MKASHRHADIGVECLTTLNHWCGYHDVPSWLIGKYWGNIGFPGGSKSYNQKVGKEKAHAELTFMSLLVTLYSMVAMKA